MNGPFVLKVAGSATRLEEPADKRATDVLIAAGICGGCAAPVLSGEVEHRDHVLSTKERQWRIILRCSRAKAAGSEIVIEL